MSFWDELKELLYKPVKQDSRNMSKLGNALGWDWLEQEGKKNVGNPGRAVGKAATAAATWYLGGLAGNALGGGGTAGSAAGTAAGAGAGAAQGALQGIGTATTEQLMQQAIQRAAIEAAQQGAQQGALQGSGMFAGDIMAAGAPGVAGAAPAPATGLFAPGVSEAESLAAMEGFGGVGSHVPTAGNVTPYAPKGWFDGPDIFGKFANGTEAKKAVAEAYKKGHINWWDMMKNTGKADLMNMNTPGEWGRRFSMNLDRMAGRAAKDATVSALMPSATAERPLGQPMPRPQQQQPPQASQPGEGSGRPDELDSATLRRLVAAHGGDPDNPDPALLRRIFNVYRGGNIWGT